MRILVFSLFVLALCMPTWSCWSIPYFTGNPSFVLNHTPCVWVMSFNIIASSYWNKSSKFLSEYNFLSWVKSITFAPLEQISANQQFKVWCIRTCFLTKWRVSSVLLKVWTLGQAQISIVLFLGTQVLCVLSHLSLNNYNQHFKLNLLSQNTAVSGD